ncbi:MAG: DUF6498-containing protein, partial [Candidatus Diapherotrites archaeon]|nr:DUF6498-containing protein [Candidatus Diapherotrites archaeon]
LAYNRKKERAKYDLAKVIFYPYIRILPMTFVVVLAFTIGQELLLPFLLLKTFVDVAMHIVEHKLFQTTPSGVVS